MKPPAPSFWLTNISDRNVSLSDLNLTINAFTSVNLLDKKHYKYTLEQLEKSVKEGSVFKKRNKIVKRNLAPEQTKKYNISINKEEVIPSRERSLFTIKETNYDELNVSDEQFAKDNIEIVTLDEKPLLKKI
jgi:hypothetical protein